MPIEVIVSVGGNQGLFGQSVEVSGATELDHEFKVDRDSIIRGVLYEKPAGSGLEVVLKVIDGPEVRYVSIDPADGFEDGVRAVGEMLMDSNRASLLVTTTGGIAGDKKISLYVSPVGRG